MTAPWIAVVVLLALVVVLNTTITLGVLRRALVVLDRASGSGSDVGGVPKASSALDFGALPLLSTPSPVHLRDRNGEDVTFPTAVSTTLIVLLMESGCEPCKALIKSIERSSREVTLPIVALLDDSEAARRLPMPASIRPLHGSRDEIANAFATSATPFAFVLGAGGVVLERGVANDRHDLEEMTRNQKGGDQTKQEPDSLLIA